ncbi:MAG: CvpA family protein [Bacteroidales bacterium]|nr:CvpA family protein [Bacteroidales bacterium]
MGVIDIIIVCCFIPALFFGMRKGLVAQIVAVLVIYFGIKLSLLFSGVVSEWIMNITSFNPTSVKILSFILIFTVVALLLNLVGKLIEKVLKITLLGWLNRLLGSIVAVFITLLILSVAAYLISTANQTFGFIPEEKLAESSLFNPLSEFAKNIFPYLKSLF